MGLRTDVHSRPGQVRRVQFVVGAQVLGQPGQIRFQTLRADVVHTLADDVQGIIYFRPVGATPVLAENAHPPGGQPGRMKNRFLLTTLPEAHISQGTSERRRRQATTI